MNASQLINQTSGAVEYFTPVEIIEAARKCMGGIDLDPASCAAANAIVLAKQIYDKYDDGLSKDWIARTVWMNHPFGRGLNESWIQKLMFEFERDHFEEACCITYACTSEKWFRPLLKHPQCFLHGRVNYRLPNGSVLKGNTKGSVVTFVGGLADNLSRFEDAFSPLGTVKI
jgi:ParB family chromosome partitioning protein